MIFDLVKERCVHSINVLDPQITSVNDCGGEKLGNRDLEYTSYFKQLSTINSCEKYEFDKIEEYKKNLHPVHDRIFGEGNETEPY